MLPLAPTRPRPRFAWLFGALVLWQVWRLLLTPYGVASTWTRSSDLAVVSTGGAGISQEFFMGADGLDGLWVRLAVPSPHAPAPSGHLIVTMADVSGGTPRPLLRQVLDAAQAASQRNLLISIPEIRASRGHRYLFTLTHASREPGDALHVQARRSDAQRSARFVVDGVEQWGDLMFEASSRRATLPYWKDHVLRAWPTWLRSWWAVAGVLVLFNLVLALACARAAGFPAVPAADAGAVRAIAPSAARGGPTRVAVASVTLVAAAGLLTAMLPSAPGRMIRLDQHMADAQLQTTWSGLHQGFDVQPVAMAGGAAAAIVALPTSRMAWTIDVPRGALLLGHAAMRPDVWVKEGDGAELTVSVESGGVRTQVASFTLVPFLVDAHRGFHPLRVSLDPWSGQRVTLIFETTPERWGNAVNDVPLWIAPRIEWPHGAKWGTARVVPLD